MAATLLLSPLLSRQFLPTRTHPPPKIPQTSPLPHPTRHPLRLRAIQQTTDNNDTDTSSSSEDITKKYGLEFGLWKIFSSRGGEKGKANQAKELLAKYGGAYLATSITLSLISFFFCYLLISAGVDVQSLLSKVGIGADETGEKVGTLALAYAAHKAASPIRFPPTVALTPIVAAWMGKKLKERGDE